MENGQWTIVVFPSEMILIVAEGDTFIVNCQLSILHSKTQITKTEEIL